MAKAERGIWLTRGNYCGITEYTLWSGKPKWIAKFTQWRQDLKHNSCLKTFDDRTFEAITGFRLEPGEIVRVPTERLKNLFRGLSPDAGKEQ